MATFKLGFRNRSVPEQLGICERAVTNISGLTPKQRTSVNLATLRDTVTAARASHVQVMKLRAELKAEVARRKEQMSLARLQVTCACGFAAANAGMTRQGMIAAGLEFERPKSPVGQPAAPAFLRADSKAEGEVQLSWQRPLRRCAFEVELRADSAKDGKWQRIDSCLRQSCILKKLTPGVKYWFRVRAVNSHGTGPWSQMATARVK